MLSDRSLTERLGRSARFGVRPGLDAIRAALDACGRPQESLRVLHVAGTNGKGATCAILDAALRRAGFRVGRYTSPHLVSLNERFFLDGAPVENDLLEAAWRKVEASCDTAALTYFELLTVVAFRLYADAGVDWAVLETGLGGRLDATNVVTRPAVTAITRIGFDHCDWLGHTLGEIAAEKAGIVKPGVPVVCGAMPSEARGVIEKTARERGAPFVDADAPDAADAIPADFPLRGAFNRENARTARAVLRTLRASGCAGVPATLAGLGARDLVWPGRFQRVGCFLVDGAHNPPALTALAAAVRDAGWRVSAVVCGFCADKDVRENARLLRDLAAAAYAVRIPNPRSLPADETAACLRASGFVAEACSDLGTALAQARARAESEGGVALVCGSLFLAGEALVRLGAYPWPPRAHAPNETFGAAAG